MSDLNRMSTTQRTGWESLAYWQDALNYWSRVTDEPYLAAEQSSRARFWIDNILFG